MNFSFNLYVFHKLSAEKIKMFIEISYIQVQKSHYHCLFYTLI